MPALPVNVRCNSTIISGGGDVEMQRRLTAGRHGSPQSATSIVHGDDRIDNAILESSAPHSVRAVVDWEMSTLDDPLAVAALMCVYRDPVFDLVIGTDAAWTSPRLPGADDMAQRNVVTSGRPLQHWAFHLALGYFKVAIIAAGIVYRRRSEDGVVDAADDAVAPLIASGLAQWNMPAGAVVPGLRCGDVFEFPGLVEVGLGRAVEPEDREPAPSGYGGDPVGGVGGLFGAERDVDGAVGVSTTSLPRSANMAAGHARSRPARPAGRRRS